MSFLQKFFPDKRQRAALAPLYAAIVAEARDPFWYREGQVPDTIDGRFDMVAAVTALVLLRLEAEGEAGRVPAAVQPDRLPVSNPPLVIPVGGGGGAALWGFRAGCGAGWSRRGQRVRR